MIPCTKTPYTPMSKPLIKLVSIALLISTFATASAQSSKPESSTAFTLALLDSALLYERLKTAHQSLHISHEQLRTQNTLLQHELHLLRLHHHQQLASAQAQVHHHQKARKRHRWLGRFEGLLLGLLLPI